MAEFIHISLGLENGTKPNKVEAGRLTLPES
jgi:hypothetical protein